jgi:hypothetical protein
MDDTQKELERLTQELLEGEELDEALLADLLKEEPTPAFDTPETIHTPQEPLVYRNYSNNYGQNPPKKRPSKQELQKKKDEKVVLGLMIAACVLSAGIIGILLHWLEVLS